MHIAETILDDLDCAVLREFDLLRDGQHGFDKLHIDLINNSTIRTEGVTGRGRYNKIHYVSLPSHIESLQTLLHVGFTIERARDIWAEWMDCLEDSLVQVPFEDFVNGHSIPRDVEDVYGDDTSPEY